MIMPCHLFGMHRSVQFYSYQLACLKILKTPLAWKGVDFLPYSIHFKSNIIVGEPNLPFIYWLKQRKAFLSKIWTDKPEDLAEIRRIDLC